MQTIDLMKKYPRLLGCEFFFFLHLYRICTTLTTCIDLSLFMLQCQNQWSKHELLISPSSSVSSDTSTAFSLSNGPLNAAIVAPHLISEYERTTYYHGISPDPPQLLWRSDLLTNPFPIPTGRYTHLPTKTAHGVFNKALSAVWHTAIPKIIKLLKDHSIRYSAIKPVRFSTLGEDGQETLGPIVLWIATPSTTTSESARDVSPAILNILEAHGVMNMVVEWYEGVVEKLSAGPRLLRVTERNNPTHYVRRLFTALLGMPIAIAEREGSVGFFFHENKTRSGDPSTRVLGISNNHVLHPNTTIDYEFKGAGAPRQYVRLAGHRRFQRGLDEIKALIAGKVIEAGYLVENISRLEEDQQKNQDPEEAEEIEQSLKTQMDDLSKLDKETVQLENFYKEVHSQWSEITLRNIGFVDWAPKISIDEVNGHKYTKDIATFEVDEVKFKSQFKGNVVDLGAFVSSFS